LIDFERKLAWPIARLVCEFPTTKVGIDVNIHWNLQLHLASSSCPHARQSFQVNHCWYDFLFQCKTVGNSMNIKIANCTHLWA
jgi:hypothetical protein